MMSIREKKRGLLQQSSSLKSNTDATYRFVQFLGAGGNCEVYLVLCTNLHNQGLLFACKVFTQVNDKERLAQFESEISFLTKNPHPCLMRIVDQGKKYFSDMKCDLPFAIAEYYPTTLDTVIASGKLRMSTKIIFFLQLLSAVKFLESLNIVHRDIKPANIFVKGNTCVLGDFGLMLDLNKIESRETEVPQSKVEKRKSPGMPRFYRTPDLVEFANGRASLSTKSDIFQLGLVGAFVFMKQVLCKEPPGRDLYAEVELRDLEDIPSNLNDSIRDLLGQMLANKPEQRPNVERLIEQCDGIFWHAANTYYDIDGYVI